jgi:NAD(P)H-dependent flavin oxidoreductase YrpB (nitropropane dioxygenase family)
MLTVPMPPLKIGTVTSRLPVIQGGMAVRISRWPLAAAVAKAGGIGLIAGSGMQPEELKEEIRSAREETTGVIGVNVMVAVSNFKTLIHAALEEGIDLVVAGAGFSRDVFTWCREAAVPMVPIVGSGRVAALSQKFGAAAVVVEGYEAGGHLGTEEYMLDLLPEILDAVDIPVIAAGGVVTGADIKRVLGRGAAGVQMGSRFAATVESSAPEDFKQMYVDATEDDVMLIQSPVGLPGRALRSPFSRRLEEGEEVGIDSCQTCLRRCGQDFCIADRLVWASEGDLEEGLVFAGSAAARVHDVPTVAELMMRLQDEYEAASEAIA